MRKTMPRNLEEMGLFWDTAEQVGETNFARGDDVLLSYVRARNEAIIKSRLSVKQATCGVRYSGRSRGRHKQRVSSRS